jgi:hypothetical protein
MRQLVKVLIRQCRQFQFYQRTFLSAPIPIPPRAVTVVTAALLSINGAMNAQTNASWKFSSAVGLKETFDNNVFLQSETVQANRESIITTLLPQCGGSWNPTPAFNAALSYSPEVTWFHSESSEDFVLHRTALNLSGRMNQTSYEANTTVVCINGSSVSPTWTGAGGAPAVGGPAVRDRRDAAVYRSSLRLTQELGKWLVRPAATFYVHDFQTQHRSTPGYQNFVDRSEFTGGLDLGRRLPPLTAWLGYRFGVQDQARLLQFPEEYDSTFQRVLLGWEGAPLSWAKFNFILGPEFRRYANTVPTTFGDRDRVNLFMDASLTLTPTKCDLLTFSVKQFEQPGFGGRSGYNDLTYDAAWRHKFNNSLTAGVGGRIYNTDFLTPVMRDDWLYSGSAFLNWNINKQWNAEASYSYESGQSKVANTSGREYTRHLVSLGLKYNVLFWP